MGLQIWLPLNGSLENKGLSDITVTNTNTNTTIETNGKIGSCYSFNGSNSGLLISNAPTIQEWTESTVCFWLKNAPTGKTQCIINHRTVAGKGLAVFLISNKIRIDTDNSMTSFDYAYNFTDWIHVAIVSKTGKRQLYINGELTETKNVTGTVAYQSSGTYASIGGSSTNATTLTGNWLQGLLNDFRLYDEALSPMQIKLISQGLVAHYLLNNNGSGLPNHFKNSNFSTGTTTGWGGVNGSIISIEEIDNKKTITAQKGTSNNLICQYVTDYEYIANTDVSFIISFDIYVTETGTITTGQWISTSEVSGWQSMTGSITWLTPNDLSIGWNHIIYKATRRNSHSGSIVTVLGYTGTTAYFTNLKFEFGDKPTPWCPNSEDALAIQLGYNDNTEYDVSGYCNNGTKYNITEYIADSPRYSLATKFNGTNSYINVGRGSMVKDEITINIWAYMNDWTTFKARLISCTEGGGWNFEPSGSKIHVGMGTGVSSNTYKNTSGYILADLTSGWHMFTATYDGFTTKQYVDGVLNTSNNAYTTKTPIFYHVSNPILIGAEASSTQNPAGNYFNGYLSDVRIYATTLSESDIQSLYNNSAFIDSSGNVYSTEYTES